MNDLALFFKNYSVNYLRTPWFGHVKSHVMHKILHHYERLTITPCFFLLTSKETQKVNYHSMSLSESFWSLQSHWPCIVDFSGWVPVDGSRLLWYSWLLRQGGQMSHIPQNRSQHLPTGALGQCFLQPELNSQSPKHSSLCIFLQLKPASSKFTSHI